MRRGRVELGAVGAAKASHIASELDHGQLHAQAYAQVRYAVFTRIADSGNFALCAALAEAARHQYGIQTLPVIGRSEEYTSELQSLMRISYAVFCFKNKT